MAKPKTNYNNMETLAADQERASVAAEESKENTKLNKKPATDFIRLDLRPRSGYDLIAYTSKRCGELGEQRGKRVTTTAFIQELIIADLKEHENKKKLSKRDLSIEKIVNRLATLDDKTIAAIEEIVTRL